ncbi:MAG TPA: hypothetical protein VKR43_11510 [Bryobacteraceae bacterium]|nr:hypothetical protein [Bryobacteraceae bacterium]
MKLFWLVLWTIAAAPVWLRGQEPAWEVRSVFGLEQSAASSSDSRLSYLLDFYVSRALGNERDASDANWLLWGNIRLESAPVQAGSSVGALLGSVISGTAGLSANDLVQSGEFQTGVEWRPKQFIWNNTNLKRRQTAGIVLGVGGTGPFSPRRSVSLFGVGEQTAQLFQMYGTALGAQGFTQANPPQYLAFTTPDRGRFYRQWLTGFRVSTFDLKNPGNPPATYTASAGQDEVVTGGGLRSAVVRFDVFYPLPVNLGGLNLIYLFGTATLRATSSPPGSTPLLLDPAPAGVTATSPGTAILTIPGNRDYYRVGVGIDLLNALRHIKVGIGH